MISSGQGPLGPSTTSTLSLIAEDAKITKAAAEDPSPKPVFRAPATWWRNKRFATNWRVFMVSKWCLFCFIFRDKLRIWRFRDDLILKEMACEMVEMSSKEDDCLSKQMGWMKRIKWMKWIK